VFVTSSFVLNLFSISYLYAIFQNYVNNSEACLHMAELQVLFSISRVIQHGVFKGRLFIGYIVMENSKDKKWHEEFSAKIVSMSF
jgi:hypothetical protein